MHPELKSLIANLPDMIVAEFNARAVPYDSTINFPVPVTALFNLIRSDCLITAGIRLNMVAEMDQVRKHLGPKAKGYKLGGSEHEVVNKLVSSVRSVLEGLSPQLYVGLCAVLLKANNECAMLRLLGTHYSNNMDRDLPVYVQYAMDWHRNWCDSALPAEMAQGNYPYPHTEVPVLAFMRAVAAIASGNAVETLSPWLKEIKVVVISKMEWLSPTETEVLRITTERLTGRDVADDFLKYFA